mmetsp:Transcript_58003/g.161863  ORF Transcript_58003/g.161863 Transcript_58003/m.161863 type:complete len:228 (+) Transcript_58003:311-994(+)
MVSNRLGDILSVHGAGHGDSRKRAPLMRALSPRYVRHEGLLAGDAAGDRVHQDVPSPRRLPGRRRGRAARRLAPPVVDYPVWRGGGVSLPDHRGGVLRMHPLATLHGTAGAPELAQHGPGTGNDLHGGRHPHHRGKPSTCGSAPNLDRRPRPGPSRRPRWRRNYNGLGELLRHCLATVAGRAAHDVPVLGTFALGHELLAHSPEYNAQQSHAARCARRTLNTTLPLL